jgi:predicted nucleotide-binding protein
MTLHLIVAVHDQPAPLIAWDLSEESLTTGIIQPYLAGGRVVLSGRVLDGKDIRSLQIIRTDRPTTEFLPQTKFAAGDGRRDWFRAEAGVDVTDTYLRPGATFAAPPESAPDRRCVWVVHGRDLALRDAMFTFLRAIGLRPLEWNQALLRTATPTPFIGEVLDAAFAAGQAIVVLLSGDDVAMLREPLRKPSDSVFESELTRQARPNVLFEAGMALGYAPKRTILVQVGLLRPFSDIGGRHLVHLGMDTASRQDLGQRLKAVGCDVDLSGVDWHKAGDFEQQGLQP